MGKGENQDDVIARGADVPLKLQAIATPRDALVDPREGDIVPGIEEKGYHVGEVRQPAEAVLRRNGDVGFESLGGESKFSEDPDESSYARDVRLLDERQQGDPAYAGRLHRPIEVTPDELRRAGFGQGAAPAGEPRAMTTPATAAPRRPATRRSPARRAPRGSESAKVERKSSTVASAQSAEDSSSS